MELMLEQMPIVIPALNAGFVQTLKLFAVTLIGALPLGLIIAFCAMSKFKPLSLFTKLIIWIIRGTPLMIQLLIIYYFPGLVLKNPIWGSGESGRTLRAVFPRLRYNGISMRGGKLPQGNTLRTTYKVMTKRAIYFLLK